MAEKLMLYVPNELGRGLQKFEFTFDGRQEVRADYRIRLGRDSLDAPVAHKITVGERNADETLLREVDIGRTLIRRIGPKGYPLCLSRLIGYIPDATDSSGIKRADAVFSYQRGTLSDLADRLPLEPRLFKQIADGLITALCYLEAAQIVHRHIRMDTVRWDENSGLVQLADFGYAAREYATPPPTSGVAPWDAPEQRGTGGGTADCRDDVYALALLLAHLATGQEFTSDQEVRETIARLDIRQQELLGKASSERRRDRPSAHELRMLMRLPDPLNAGLRADRGRESEARAQFADLRRRQEPARRRLQAEAKAAVGRRSDAASPGGQRWQVPPLLSAPAASAPATPTTASATLQGGPPRPRAIVWWGVAGLAIVAVLLLLFVGGVL